MVVFTDSEGLVRTLNRAARERLGLDPARSPSLADLLEPRTHSRWRNEILPEVVASGGWRGMGEWVDAKGAAVPVHWEAMDDEGKGIVLIGRESTPFVELDAAMFEARERIRAASRALLRLAKSPSFHGENLFVALEEITEAAGRLLDVARVGVWLYDRDRTLIRCIDLFELAEGRHASGDELRCQDHPAYFFFLEEDRMIVADDARVDPRTCEYAGGYLARHGITSMLDVAARSKGELVGVVCFEHVGPKRTWTIEDQVSAGAIADLVSLALEASERSRVEQKLRERQRDFDEIFENTSDLIVMLEFRSAGRLYFLDANGAFERSTGIARAALQGTPLEAILSAENSEMVRAACEECRASGRPVAGEATWKTPAGERRLDSVAVPMRDALGKIDRIAAISRDVTERRRVEEELRRSRQRYQLHLENTPLAAMDLDVDFRVVSWNPAACATFGWSAEEARGREAWFIVHPEDAPAVERVWHDLLANRGGRRSTNRNVTKDGRSILCEWYNTPLVDEAGRVIGVASLSQDVTERESAALEIRRLNAELEGRVALRTRELAAANRELAAANQELDAFCHSVSHDLRAPLRAIDGFSLALLEDYHDRLDQEGREYLRRVRAASQRMGELIDDLLQLSRVTRVQMRKDRVDLGEIARRIAAELRAQEPGRSVEFRIAPEIFATGDAKLLEIALRNLLGNAWKYTSRAAKATIEVGKIDDPPERIVFVTDDGAGFDPAYAGKLFAPFQRLHGRHEFEGHGIGLATVARIAHRHGGRVWAEGQVGKGATFYFSLPDDDAEETALASPVPGAPAATGSAGPTKRPGETLS